MHVEIKRICVPTDFSPAADHAIHFAATLAEQNKAELHLVHVLHDATEVYLHPDFTASGEEVRDFFNQMEIQQLGPNAPSTEIGPPRSDIGPPPSEEVHEYLRHLEKGTKERFAKLPVDKWWERVKVFKAVRYGNTVDEICGYARRHEIDLLVVGTHGHTGIKRWLLGSVAERIVRVAPCAVLTVRPVMHDFIAED